MVNILKIIEIKKIKTKIKGIDFIMEEKVNILDYDKVVLATHADEALINT